MGLWAIGEFRPVQRTWDFFATLPSVSADHALVYPEIDNRCYRVNTKEELYDLLRNEHGWRGTINPENVGENPTYPMKLERMYYPDITATSRFHHYAIYAQEIQQITQLQRVIEMYHGLEIEDGAYARYKGAGFKHVIWDGGAMHADSYTTPVCWYIFGPGLPKGPPTPPSSFVDQVSTTTNATSTGQ